MSAKKQPAAKIAPIPDVARPTIAAVLIVRDEESSLPRCLASISSVVDQLVVVDTGSLDRTVELAREAGATILFHEWNDDFSAARNVGLEAVTCEWVLSIDADEELAEGSVDAIRRAVKFPGYGGFEARIVSYLDDLQRDRQVHYTTRLFKLSPGIRFSGRIHEQVAAAIEAEGLKRAKLDGFVVDHFGYQPSILEARDKAERAVRLLRKEIAENPSNGFNWFNLAIAYQTAKHFDEAEKAAKLAIRMGNDHEGYVGPAYRIIVGSLIAQSKPEEALEAVNQAEERGFPGPDLRALRAEALLLASRAEEALSVLDSAPIETCPLDIEFGDTELRTANLRGRLLLELGRLEEALRTYRLAYKDNPDNAETAMGLASTLSELGRCSEAMPILARTLRQPSLGSGALWVAARIHVKCCQYRRAVALFERMWRQGGQNDLMFAEWAEASQKLGDSNAVMMAYEAYAGSNELSANMLVNWGRLLKSTDQPDRALVCFSEAIRRDPTEANAYFNCGDLLFELGAHADAAHLYENALRLQPNHITGWFVLGNALYHLGLKEASLKAYEQALALDGSFEPAEANRAVVLNELQGEDAAA